ncbi:MAG TPA: S8 family serine peptidase [Thermoanaerobaculia bacterium]|nr:S8 family serine peptidase [Thermoanaerobaculia bacterium]
MKRLLILIAIAASSAAQQVHTITAGPNGPAQVSITRSGRIIETPRLTSRVIIEFRKTPAHFEQDLHRIHATTQSIRTAPRITHTFTRVYSGVSAIVDAKEIPAIRALEYVKAVHIDREVHALVVRQQAAALRGVSKINAPAVWATTRGAGVTVAIIDTGIDYKHPAFGNRVVGGYDFVNGDDDPLDDNGHGTHVAGIVGANGGGLTGVAPDVHFLAYKVLDQYGSGYDSTILAAVERAVDPNGDGDTSDHADVVNMSLGRPGTPDDELSKAIDNATAAGVVFCIAAGNDGQFFTIGTPANAPSAIAVGASDDKDRIADFSSKGPVSGSLAVKPEVVAPGVAISSAKLGGDTVTESGTSMATPHVAGVVALLKSLHHDWTPVMLKSAIVQSALPLGNEAMIEGAGRVDASRAIASDLFAMPSTIGFGRDRSSNPLWTGLQTFTLTNGSSRPMSLSLNADSAGDGITLDISPAAFMLAPGQSQTVTLLLQVDNAVVPAPLEGSLAFGGVIQILGGAMTMRVPWAFVKAAEMTIHYDGDDSFSASAVSISSRAVVRAYAGLNEHDVRVHVPIGAYDVEVTPSSIDDTYRWIIVERQSISDTATVNVSAAMAQHEVSLSARDDRGQLLENRRNCSHQFGLIWPDGSGMNGEVLLLFPDTRLLMSPLSSRFTLVPVESCTEPQGAAYAAGFAPINGIAGNVTRTVDSSMWTRVPVRIAVPPDAVRPEGVIGSGVLIHGPLWALHVFSGEAHPAEAGTVWTGTAFVTAETHPNVSPTTAGQVKMAPPAPFEDLPPDAPSLARFTGVGTPIIRLTARGLDLSPWLRDDPATYVPRPGEVMTFGTGLALPRSFIFIGDEQLFTDTSYLGGFGESRNAEANGAEVKLYDSADQLVQSGKIFIDPWADFGEEQYRLEITRPARVHGIAGESHVTARFDTSQPDHAPPVLMSLRLLDANGSIASDFFPHANGALQFSAIDLVPVGPNEIDGGPVRVEATSVRWKTHGSDAWHELPYTIVANGLLNLKEAQAAGHPSFGTLFRCDLAPVTREPALIDLQLHLEDPAGNSYEYSLAPAFSVGVPGRARPSPH